MLDNTISALFRHVWFWAKCQITIVMARTKNRIKLIVFTIIFLLLLLLLLFGIHTLPTSRNIAVLHTHKTTKRKLIQITLGNLYSCAHYGYSHTTSGIIRSSPKKTERTTGKKTTHSAYYIRSFINVAINAKSNNSAEWMEESESFSIFRLSMIAVP